jgi:tripartite-type tricarboxylate transporter receptor subunit TctC
LTLNASSPTLPRREWFVEQPIPPITRADLPAATAQQFRAYATVNHPRMQFGSSGVGSGSHFSCAGLNAALGIVPTHVPYRGSAAAMQNLIAGRIDYFCVLGAAAMGPLEAGSAKAIAVLTSERSHLVPVGRP